MTADLGQRLDWASRQIELPAGRYQTMLSPSAMADLFIYLYWSAVAKDALDGRTVFSKPGGGTRLGETLRSFLDRWGQRGPARGAVGVVFSDGWERGDAVLLGEQMRRLRMLAHRVVWVNPHVGKDGYAPVQLGIVAALPFVDELVAGHSLAAFAELVEVVAHA